MIPFFLGGENSGTVSAADRPAKGQTIKINYRHISEVANQINIQNPVAWIFRIGCGIWYCWRHIRAWILTVNQNPPGSSTQIEI